MVLGLGDRVREVEGWNGLAVEVCWRFGSSLAWPASQYFDEMAEVVLLPFNGVTLMGIDVGKGVWVVWKVRGGGFWLDLWDALGAWQWLFAGCVGSCASGYSSFVGGGPFWGWVLV